MVLPGYLRQFTVAHYLQALVPHAMPSEGIASLLQGLLRDAPTMSVSLCLAGGLRGSVPVAGDPGGRAAGVYSRAVALVGRPDHAPRDEKRNPGHQGFVITVQETRMSKKTRYFVLVSGAILTLGLGTGLVASYMGLPVSLLSSAAGPDELQYVPQDATVVAYANVRDVMNSEFRQRFREMEPTLGRTQRVRAEDRPQHRKRHRHGRRGVHERAPADSRSTTRSVRPSSWRAAASKPPASSRWPSSTAVRRKTTRASGSSPTSKAVSAGDASDGRGLRRIRPRRPRRHHRGEARHRRRRRPPQRHVQQRSDAAGGRHRQQQRVGGRPLRCAGQSGPAAIRSAVSAADPVVVLGRRPYQWRRQRSVQGRSARPTRPRRTCATCSAASWRWRSCRRAAAPACSRWSIRCSSSGEGKIVAMAFNIPSEFFDALEAMAKQKQLNGR